MNISEKLIAMIEKPEIIGWQLTKSEQGIEMATLPSVLLRQLIAYTEQIEAGYVKKEEWIPIKDAEKFFNDFYGKYVTVLCPIYNRATKLMSWEMYHVEIDNNGDLFYADGSGDCGITYKDVDFYRVENFPPLPSPTQNKEQ